MQRLAELPLNRKNMFLGAINKEILFERGYVLDVPCGNSWAVDDTLRF